MTTEHTITVWATVAHNKGLLYVADLGAYAQTLLAAPPK
jgi:hypothetical protein